jgi:hypothetical protein
MAAATAARARSAAASRTTLAPHRSSAHPRSSVYQRPAPAWQLGDGRELHGERVWWQSDRHARPANTRPFACDLALMVCPVFDALLTPPRVRCSAHPPAGGWSSTRSSLRAKTRSMPSAPNAARSRSARSQTRSRTSHHPWLPHKRLAHHPWPPIVLWQADGGRAIEHLSVLSALRVVIEMNEPARWAGFVEGLSAAHVTTPRRVRLPRFTAPHPKDDGSTCPHGAVRAYCCLGCPTPRILLEGMICGRCSQPAACVTAPLERIAERRGHTHTRLRLRE